MLPALRHLSVLPLWFSFGPGSSSFESTYPTSPSLPRFPVWLCWQPWTPYSQLPQEKPVHPPASGTSGPRL
ncbi:hypothetical protein AMECASPLE_019227 [Ameca splendens]|uniref:Secreted protein n=1 Tax=Ameca splendens TaxID=208324 RepID=A0ABV0Z133_9TELE